MQMKFKRNPFKPVVIIMLLGMSILAFVMGASAQSVSDGAKTIGTTRNVPADDLRDCSQMLDQSIEENRACADKVKYLELLLKARDEQLQTTKELAAERLVTISAKDKTIERLEAIKCSTTTFFFVYKKKSCY